MCGQLAPSALTATGPVYSPVYHTLLLRLIDFNSIICLDNAFSAAAVCLEFLALVKLRYSQ